MRIVYCGQFRDRSGYAIAARGYLKSIDHYLSQNKDSVELKIYSTIVNEDTDLSSEYIDLIQKYEFKDDEEIKKWMEGDYLFIWHMPPAMIAFTDDKFKATPGCSQSVNKLLKHST